jgi:hypothetical protein
MEFSQQKHRTSFMAKTHVQFTPRQLETLPWQRLVIANPPDLTHQLQPDN